MSNVAKRRVIRDLRRLEIENPSGICAAPCPSNMMNIHAIIEGPIESDWEAGESAECKCIFHLIITFPSDYPLKPPNVRFLSNIFHPNVYPDGRICLDILQNQWGPAYDLLSLLASIRSLLSDPNVDSPARVEAATLLRENPLEYRRRIFKCVEESWDIPELSPSIAATFV